MKALMAGALALLFATSGAEAGDSRQSARDSIEASMLVTGTIDVDEAGAVERFAVDDAGKVPPLVRQLLDQELPGWRFEPTLADGRPAAVRTSMRIRVTARKVPGEEDSYSIGINGASFGGDPPGEGITSLDPKPPVFPYQLLQRDVGGTVYLLLKIGRDGKVEDMVAEQVNLRAIGHTRMMRTAREVFANAAMRAARGWRFRTPAAGPDADAPFWSVRVPVDFLLEGQRPPGYGEWSSYVPGPRVTAPWEIEEDGAVGADTYAAGGVYQVGQGSLKLLTPLASR